MRLRTRFDRSREKSPEFVDRPSVIDLNLRVQSTYINFTLHQNKVFCFQSNNYEQKLYINDLNTTTIRKNELISHKFKFTTKKRKFPPILKTDRIFHFILFVLFRLELEWRGIRP